MYLLLLDRLSWGLFPLITHIMGIPAHWGVFAPPIYRATEGSPQRGSNMPSSSRSSSGSSSSKKEESLGMMEADAMYYQQGQLAISGQEAKINGEMVDFYMNDGGTPPAEKQVEWNRSLAAIEQAKMTLRAQEPGLKERFNQYKDIWGKANSNTPGNSANRIMVTEQNGLWSSYIGPKQNGGLGMLTQNEMLEYNKQIVGIGANGAPGGLDFQSSVGYSGDFLTEFNTMMQGSSKDIKSSVNAGTIEADGNKWIQLLETADDETQLRKIANTMWYSMTPSARTDLMSQFHEDMIRGGTIQEGKNKDKYFFKMTTEGQGYLLTDEETKVINAYANGRKLTGEQKEDLKRIQEGYAETMIALMVPGKVARTMTIDRIKTSGSGSGGIGGGDDVVTGPNTNVSINLVDSSKGQQPDPEPNFLLVKDGEVVSPIATPEYPKYTIPNPRYLTEANASFEAGFTSTAVTVDNQSIKPYAYYNGVPNNVQIFEQNGVKILGVVGEMRVMPQPVPMNTPDDEGNMTYTLGSTQGVKYGNTFSGGKWHKNGKDLTSRFVVAVPKDNAKNLRKIMRDHTGAEITFMTDRDFPELNWRVTDEKAKQMAEEYELFYLDIPIDDASKPMRLPGYDNISIFEKGKNAYAAWLQNLEQQDKANDVAQTTSVFEQASDKPKK